MPRARAPRTSHERCGFRLAALHEEPLGVFECRFETLLDGSSVTHGEKSARVTKWGRPTWPQTRPCANQAPKGSTILTRAFSKSARFRVATIKPCTRAVAAI